MQGLRKFCKAGGEFGGKDNQAYWPVANLVEKFSIAFEKPKSNKRKALDAEVANGRLGRDGRFFSGVDPSPKFLCFAGERPGIAKDALGRTIVTYKR